MIGAISLFLSIFLLIAHSTQASIDFSSIQKGGGSCETHTDCQHDGRCHIPIQDLMINELQEGSCSCNPSYVGPQCEYYCPLKCWNGGTCAFRSDVRFAHIRGEMPYQCMCPDGYMGDRCEIRYDLCPDKQTKCTQERSCMEGENGEYFCVLESDTEILKEVKAAREISSRDLFLVVVGVTASVLSAVFLAMKRFRTINVKTTKTISRSSSQVSFCNNCFGSENEELENPTHSEEHKNQSTDNFEVI